MEGQLAFVGPELFELEDLFVDHVFYHGGGVVDGVLLLVLLAVISIVLVERGIKSRVLA